jgi:endo-1,4-beta-D-glucanase Y/4-amino-4-deoxy-L-arabinose transferase-like glycosyltransferase
MNNITIQQFSSFIKRNSTLLILVSLLLISAVSHAYNMFHFPYYENDEGTYMSQAWSLLTQGKLEPYTYWYDHAPLGWVFIALWTVLTGGFFTFGVAVNSGRVFMLILHLFSTFFLFKITKKISGKTLAATIAVLLFSLSPLGIYYQRRVLLDNIMTFWTLFSLFLLTNTGSKLRYAVLSALTFGIAVLSKENAVFFIPAFMYVIGTKFNKRHITFAFVQWIAISACVISLYFIFALLRNEFFPVGFLGNNTPHVSLITTLQDQFARGTNLPFWNPASDFYNSLQTWLNKDAFIIVAGAIASLATILLSWKTKKFRLPALLVAFMWLFLLRGKLVIDFYIIPLLPFLQMSIGMVSEFIIEKITKNTKYVYIPLGILALFGISIYYYFHQIGQYTHDETTPQVEAITWIKNNLPANANIIIDDYMYVDLHAPRFAGDKVFPNANWAWKIEDDPAVTLSKTDSNWTQTIYVALSHEIVKQIKSGNFPFIKKAINNATILEDWDGGYDFRNLSQFISTNGDWMSIYKVKNRFNIVLDNSWNYYKNTFIHSYGQVIDPQTNTTTSDGQAEAMLKAVWENDQSTFNGLWAWTHDHFQYRLQDKLFSSEYVKKGNKYGFGETATSSGADQDIAMALLLAYNRWHNPKYLEAAKPIISDIWEQEVVKINDTYYLTAGTGAGEPNGYMINVSAISPAYYPVFAKIDPSHPWDQLKTDSYDLLNGLSKESSQLPPDQIIIENGTGAILPAEVSNENSSLSLFFRVALDAKWNNSKQAIAYLDKYKAFFDKEKLSTNSTSTQTANALDTLSIIDSANAQKLYQNIFDKENNLQLGYWGDKTNYESQNAFWFATALYSNNTSLIKN